MPTIDYSSGQVYTDHRIRATPNTLLLHHNDYSRNGRSWAHERPFLPIEWAEGEGMRSDGVGANSLKQTAMRHVLADQRRVRREHVEVMGWPLAGYLWGKLGDCQMQTLYMWKLLCASYPLQFYDLSTHHCMRISDLRMPFAEYIADLTDDSDVSCGGAKGEGGEKMMGKLKWGVVLTLATDFVRIHELLNLSKLSNLVALEVKTQPLPTWDLARRMAEQYQQQQQQQQQSASATMPVQITDRVIRSWSELARKGTAFQHLRIMMLRLQNGGAGSVISEHVFSYLRSFPSLVGVAVVECPVLQTERAKEVAQAEGWKVYDLRKRTQTCKTVCELLMDYVASLDDEGEEGGGGEEEEGGGGGIKRTPILEFAIELPLAEKRKILPHIRLFTRDEPSKKAAAGATTTTAPGSNVDGDGLNRGEKHRMSSGGYSGGGNGGEDDDHDNKKPRRRRRPVMRANSRVQKDVFDLLAELQE